MAECAVTTAKCPKVAGGPTAELWHSGLTRKLPFTHFSALSTSIYLESPVLRTAPYHPRFSGKLLLATLFPCKEQGAFSGCLPPGCFSWCVCCLQHPEGMARTGSLCPQGSSWSCVMTNRPMVITAVRIENSSQ